MATGWYGPTSTDALLFTIGECLEDWGDDAAYNKVGQKLREVQQELDTLSESPGRAAARAAAASQSGQNP